MAVAPDAGDDQGQFKPVELTAKISGNIFHRRQKVTIELPVAGNNSANLSISVHRKNPFGPSNTNIFEKRTDRGQSLPLVAQRAENLPDLRGELISGTVKDQTSGKALAWTRVFLSSPSKDYVFLVSETDSTGHFFFNTRSIRSSGDLVLQLSPDAPYGYEIRLEDDFLTDHSAIDVPSLELDTAWLSTIRERSVFDQIENAYFAVKKDTTVKGPSARFFGKPSVIYKLDDYTRFPTLEDIFREYVPEVVVKKRNDKFELRVINAHTGFQFVEEPLVLIDGVPVFDTEVAMKYDPLKIQTMEILRRKYFYSTGQWGGIISFSTYRGDAPDLQAPGWVKARFSGITPRKRYYAPKYDSVSAMRRIPDYRVQLCWMPEVKLAAGEQSVVTFYTGDATGEFDVEIEGWSNGRPVHFRKSIEVIAD